MGTTGVAVGCAGLAALRVHTGERDDAGRVLQGTEVHLADQVASASELVVGPLGGVPAAIVRGLAWTRSDAGAQAGLMPADRDLFRGPAPGAG
jgi:coenzyme F420-0:L-glutamate ligase/coenzyme F420-1:gamma-L-glutamate ligase